MRAAGGHASMDPSPKAVEADDRRHDARRGRDKEGGAIASLRPLVAGALLDDFWWGSVFLITEDLLARCHEEDTALGAGAASLADTAPTGSAG